jgi:hypothetical protein
MYRTATSLTFMIAATALAVLPALAQSPAASQDGLGVQQPNSGSPQPSGLQEDFEQDPVTGWAYSCEHAIVSAGNGRALATRGGGHAVWEAAGEVTDFAMKFLYSYERGAGDVFFRSTDTDRGMEFYFLRLEPRQVVLGRRLHTEDHKYPEKTLAAAPVSLGPRAWHEVIIQAKGGHIAVWIDGKGVLQVQDPNPLQSGMCGLGAIADSGHVLYDQVMLVHE